MLFFLFLNTFKVCTTELHYHLSFVANGNLPWVLRNVIVSQTKLKITVFFASFLVTVAVFTSTLARVKKGIWKVDVYVINVSPTWDVAWFDMTAVHFVSLDSQSLSLLQKHPPAPAEVCVAQRNMFGHIAGRYWEVHVSSCRAFSW